MIWLSELANAGRSKGGIMHLYADQFSTDHDYPRVERPSKVVVIASTARCGSHMLGHALHKTNNFGFPLEYLNSANLSEWKRLLAVNDTQAVITEVQKKRTSPNGVFGIKIHYSQIRQLGGFDNLLRTFPGAYYILLSRKDILRQAVSLSIASQTGEWIAGQEPTNNNPIYNFAHIDKCLSQTILHNASWRYSLAASGSNYMELDFQDVRDDVAGSIIKIAAFSGVSVINSEISDYQITKSQSSNRNIEWEERFISEFNRSKELLDDQYGEGVIRRLKVKLHRALKAK